MLVYDLRFDSMNIDTGVYRDLSEDQINRIEDFLAEIKDICVNYPTLLDRLCDFLVGFEKEEHKKEHNLMVVSVEFPLFEYILSLTAKRGDKSKHLELVQKAAESNL
ncbi:hypothetical protein ES705_19562 [subsurface metagenome]